MSQFKQFTWPPLLQLYLKKSTTKKSCNLTEENKLYHKAIWMIWITSRRLHLIFRLISVMQYLRKNGFNTGNANASICCNITSSIQVRQKLEEAPSTQNIWILYLVYLLLPKNINLLSYFLANKVSWDLKVPSTLTAWCCRTLSFSGNPHTSSNFHLITFQM